MGLDDASFELEKVKMYGHLVVPRHMREIRDCLNRGS